MKDRPYWLSSTQKQEILERDLFLCAYCGGVATWVDHVVPYSYSQCSDKDNLVASCEECNLIAGNKVFKDFAAKGQYIRTRKKSPKFARRLVLKAVPVCNSCGKIFQQRDTAGSSMFYCADCERENENE